MLLLCTFSCLVRSVKCPSATYHLTLGRELKNKSEIHSYLVFEFPSKHIRFSMDRCWFECERNNNITFFTHGVQNNMKYPKLQAVYKSLSCSRTPGKSIACSALFIKKTSFQATHAPCGRQESSFISLRVCNMELQPINPVMSLFERQPLSKSAGYYCLYLSAGRLLYQSGITLHLTRAFTTLSAFAQHWLSAGY